MLCPPLLDLALLGFGNPSVSTTHFLLLSKPDEYSVLPLCLLNFIACVSACITCLHQGVQREAVLLEAEGLFGCGEIKI